MRQLATTLWLVLICSVGMMSCSNSSPPPLREAASGDGGHTGTTDDSEQTTSGGAMGAGGGDSTASGGRRASGGSDSVEGAGGQTDTASGGQATGSPAEPSLGCGTTSELVSGTRSLDVGGTDREFILTLPEHYDSQKPYRLVLGFHGRMYDAAWVANGEAPLTGPYFGLLQLSEDSTIFVAPQALSSSWSNQDGRDVDFVEALLDTLQAELCVDRSRVFAVGFSYGAIMTATLGCELYDRLTAVAPMSASLPEGCGDGLPKLAYWGSHGTEDQTIPIAQGEAVRDSYIARNHCDSTPPPVDANGCVAYLNCDAGAPTVWCPFSGEHVPAPFVGAALWPFFAQF